MRQTHTTKQEKAKCLAYRNGKRCGRVAKVEVQYKDTLGNWCHPTVCQECAERIIKERGAKIRQESRRGFYVQSCGGFSGMASRQYIKVGE